MIHIHRLYDYGIALDHSLAILSNFYREIAPSIKSALFTESNTKRISSSPLRRSSKDYIYYLGVFNRAAFSSEWGYFYTGGDFFGVCVGLGAIYASYTSITYSQSLTC